MFLNRLNFVFLFLCSLGYHINVQSPLLVPALQTLDEPGKTIAFCSGPADIFIPKTVTLTPDPPLRGQKLVIALNGTLKAAVDEGGIAHVVAKLGFIKLLDRDYSICEYAHEVDKECPLEKGPLTIYKEVDIPNEVPPVSAIAYLS